MGHFQVKQVAPGLLADPAAAAATLDQLKGGQIVGMIVQPHESAGPQQFKHIGELDGALPFHDELPRWRYPLFLVKRRARSSVFVPFSAWKP